MTRMALNDFHLLVAQARSEAGNPAFKVRYFVVITSYGT